MNFFCCCFVSFSQIVNSEWNLTPWFQQTQLCVISAVFLPSPHGNWKVKHFACPVVFVFGWGLRGFLVFQWDIWYFSKTSLKKKKAKKKNLDLNPCQTCTGQICSVQIHAASVKNRFSGMLKQRWGIQWLCLVQCRVPLFHKLFSLIHQHLHQSWSYASPANT